MLLDWCQIVKSLTDNGSEPLGCIAGYPETDMFIQYLFDLWIQTDLFTYFANSLAKKSAMR
jgi:hypothetical protein